jgi:uncharacterized coiled-coil protein SlyX
MPSSSLYLSRAVVACYENDGADDGTAGAGVPAPGPSGPAPGGQADSPGDAEKKFSQLDLNTFLAVDKRKHQAQLHRVEKMLEEVSAAHTAKDARVSELETQLAAIKEEIQTANLTAEQKAERAHKQHVEQLTGKLTAEQKAAQDWKSRCERSAIRQAITDAAVANGADPKQMIRLLEASSRVTFDESGNNPRVEFDLDNGDQVVTYPMGPGVGELKLKPEFQPFFRANSVGGSGTNNSVNTQAGGTPAAGGKVDRAELARDPARYMQLRSTPEGRALLGLRERRR